LRRVEASEGWTRVEDGHVGPFVTRVTFRRPDGLLVRWESRLQFQREALDQAGIPYAWDPFEPESTMDPFGMPATFKLLVPEADVSRARQLLADLDAAEMIFPPEFAEDVVAWDEGGRALEAAGLGRTGLRGTHPAAFG